MHKFLKNVWVRRILIIVVILCGVIFAYFVYRFSFESFYFPNKLPPELTKDVKDKKAIINYNVVFGYNIIEGVGGVITLLITVFGLYFAYKELKKFNIQKNDFMPLAQPLSIEVWSARSETTGRLHFFALNRIKINGHWEKNVFSILPETINKDGHKGFGQPIFVIQNLGRGVADDLNIKIYSTKTGNGTRYNLTRFIEEEFTCDLAPGGHTIVFKDEKYAGFDPMNNFAVKLTYRSEYTQENIEKTFEAHVVTIKVKINTLCKPGSNESQFCDKKGGEEEIKVSYISNFRKINNDGTITEKLKIPTVT